MQHITDSGLFKKECFIGGTWCKADDGSIIEVFNPYDNSRVGSVPRMGEAETKRAIDAAAKAFKQWSAMSPSERAMLLLAWNEEIQKHKQDLAHILTLEQGKPLAESLGEIVTGASYIPWFAEEGKRAYGDVIPAPRKGVQPITRCFPVGVVAAITPWNFPSSMLTRKASAALAAGCTMVCKPASATPFSALALAELARRAGIPNGVLNVISGSAGAIGAAIAENSEVRALTFTGSTAVGKELMANMSMTMKRLGLELGGNAPFIVFDDADIDKAVNVCMGSKFRNAGQTCICSNRIFVERKVHDEFANKLAERAAALKIGSGLEQGVEIGPLIDEAAAKNSDAMVKDAVANGAKIFTGGMLLPAKGKCFFAPTVLTGMTTGMRVFREEIFGPVAPIMAFDKEEEVIALANDTPYGLAAYVCTNNTGRTLRVTAALEYGLVGVNDAVLAMPEVPFGGVKESGYGKEGGREGLHDFMETRYTLIGGL